MPQLTYLEAIRQGIWEEMDRDPTVFCIGEDIGIYGGAFKVTDGFIDRFGPERVIDTPIAESAIVGAAFGARTIGWLGTRVQSGRVGTYVVIFVIGVLAILRALLR